MMLGEFVVSTAHDWRGGSGDTLTCIRCGHVAEIGAWSGARCNPHHEHKDSGYIDEAEGG